MLKKLFGKRKLASGLAIVGLMVGLLALTAGVVSAHGGGIGFRGRFGGIDEEALLADELGITVEELQAARESARDTAAAQALEEGLITQEQYDTMQVMQSLRPYLDPQALQAEVLGIDPETLRDQPLNAWLDELGIDRESFQADMQAAHDAAVSQAVADGVITQAQADALPEHGLPGIRGGRDMRGRHPEGFNGMRDGSQGGPLDGGNLDDSALRGRLQMAPSSEA